MSQSAKQAGAAEQDREPNQYKNRPKQVIVSKQEPWEHRCALEHSLHYQRMQQKSIEASKKLLLVTAISVVFMLVEIVGGVLSNSIAILTDAAHQMSDVAGFGISFLAVYVTRKRSNLQYNYGYHRADAIGALTTVLIIWVLLIWLLAEAVKRLINPPKDINGGIMLITAGAGLVCNVANLLTLQCCFNEQDEEGNDIPLMASIASAYKPHRGQTYKYAGSRRGSRIASRHGSSIAEVKSLLGSVKSKPSRRSKKVQKEAQSDHRLINTNTPPEQTHGLQASKEKLIDDAEHKALLESRNSRRSFANEGSSKKLVKDDNVAADVEAQSNKISGAPEKASARNKSPDAHSVNSDDEEQVPRVMDVDQVSQRVAEREEVVENMNVRAAIIHMIGDIVQSVGVMAAAIIIYVKPTWTIADPICTFLFSVLVLMTTIPIFIDVMGILMETTPDDVEVVDLFNALTKLDVVDEVHDLHISSLGEGKPILSAHVVSDANPSYTLYKITELLQQEFEIFHSTIQVEPNKKSHMRKEGSGLLKCINEHNFMQKLPSKEVEEGKSPQKDKND